VQGAAKNVAPTQLATRIGVGGVFFEGGLLEYSSWEFTVRLFQDEYKVPQDRSQGDP